MTFESATKTYVGVHSEVFGRILEQRRNGLTLKKRKNEEWGSGGVGGTRIGFKLNVSHIFSFKKFSF